MTTGELTLTRPRRRATDRRSPKTTREAHPSVGFAGRERVAAALARRGARERLVLTLLLYERLFPVEVADTLGLSLRQVERTYDSLLTDLRRSLGRPYARASASAGSVVARQRRAA